MKKLTAESNIADIAARFNELKGTDTDPKTLAKRGKAKLLAAIEEMEAAAKPAKKSGMAQAIDTINGGNGKKAESATAAPKAKKAAAEKKPKAPKVQGPTIRSVAEDLLLEVVTRDEDKRPFGYTYDEILDRIREKFPEAKTTAACLRWYAVHMRERGEKVPNRRRVQPAKKAD